MNVYADMIQGTPEWRLARCGIPTASKFGDVREEDGPRGGIAKGRQTYMYKLAGEIITGQPVANVTTETMDRGHEREQEARELYAFLNDVEVKEVGFIRDGNCGYSPDGTVSYDGLWENKDAEPHIQIGRLLLGTLPPEHEAQCQGGLMVAQRDWIDFQSTCRDLPTLLIRVERNEPYIARLRIAINEFVDELNDLVEKIRSL